MAVGTCRESLSLVALGVSFAFRGFRRSRRFFDLCEAKGIVREGNRWSKPSERDILSARKWGNRSTHWAPCN
jgi:hypothetical protein